MLRPAGDRHGRRTASGFPGSRLRSQEGRSQPATRLGGHAPMCHTRVDRPPREAGTAGSPAHRAPGNSRTTAPSAGLLARRPPQALTSPSRPGAPRPQPTAPRRRGRPCSTRPVDRGAVAEEGGRPHVGDRVGLTGQLEARGRDAQSDPVGVLHRSFAQPGPSSSDALVELASSRPLPASSDGGGEQRPVVPEVVGWAATAGIQWHRST